MLTTLRQIVMKFTAQSHFADAVKTLVVDVKQAMGVDVCSIYLLDPARSAYALAATDGLNLSQVGEATLAEDQGLVGLVGRSAENLGARCLVVVVGCSVLGGMSGRVWT